MRRRSPLCAKWNDGKYRPVDWRLRRLANIAVLPSWASFFWISDGVLKDDWIWGLPMQRTLLSGGLLAFKPRDIWGEQDHGDGDPRHATPLRPLGGFLIKVVDAPSRSELFGSPNG
jgi:hypothetical protein